MSSNVGNGIVTIDAVTKDRIHAAIFAMAKDPEGNDLNMTFGTQPEGETPPDWLGIVPQVDHGYSFFVTARGPGKLYCIKQGYKSEVIDVVFPIPETGSALTIEMDPDGAEPLPVSTLHLEMRGNDLVDANGNPTCYPCIDRFNVPRMWMDGKFAEVDALIDEQLKLGMTWARMLFMGHVSQNRIFSLSPNEPGFDRMVVELTDHHNERGVGILGEVHADNQVVGMDPPSHFRRMTDLWQGKIAIPSGGNEAGKNGFDPQTLPAPADPNAIWTRGSGLADELVMPNGAPCTSFHQRTDMPTMLRDTVASAVEMELRGCRVILMDEPTRFNFDGTNKSQVADSVLLAKHLGAVYGSFWDLADFHHQAGQLGLLMDATGLRIAEAWMYGLHVNAIQ